MDSFYPKKESGNKNSSIRETQKSYHAILQYFSTTPTLILNHNSGLDAHLASSQWRLGKQAKTLKVRLEVSAEFHLHGLHPLVRWVHGFGCWPVRKMKWEGKWRRHRSHLNYSQNPSLTLVTVHTGLTCCSCRKPVHSAAACREPSSVWTIPVPGSAGWCRPAMLNL